jgi:hypothetical protein
MLNGIHCFDSTHVATQLRATAALAMHVYMSRHNTSPSSQKRGRNELVQEFEENLNALDLAYAQLVAELAHPARCPLAVDVVLVLAYP